MSELVALAYPDEWQASKVMDALKRLDQAGTMDLDEAVAVAKDHEGRINVEGAPAKLLAARQVVFSWAPCSA